MNAPAILAHIEACSRELERYHYYDIVVRMRDGTKIESTRERFIARPSVYMRKVCAWLHRTGRWQKVESIELLNDAGRERWTITYPHWWSPPVLPILPEEELPYFMRRQAL